MVESDTEIFLKILVKKIDEDIKGECSAEIFSYNSI